MIGGYALRAMPRQLYATPLFMPMMSLPDVFTVFQRERAAARDARVDAADC